MMHAGSLESTREAPFLSILPMEMYDENPQKIWTGERSQFPQAIRVLDRIMIDARPTEFDRTNLVAMV